MNLRDTVYEQRLAPGELPDPEWFVTDDMAMTLYIAGPMTDHPAFNYPAFDNLADALRYEGFNAVSPAELDTRETRSAALASPDGSPGSGTVNGETWGDFLSRDVKIISDVVDGVVLMPGWEASKGARLEAFIARHVGKPVFYSLIGRSYEADIGPSHDKVCFCHELFVDGEIPEVDLVELDDAELDHVLTMTDGLTLLKIQQDTMREELDAPVQDWISGIKVQTTNVIPSQLTVLTPGETRIVDPETGGEKGSKIERFDLIPAEVRRQDALVYGAGAKKYADDNWRKGYSWRLSLAAMYRHINKFELGEVYDEELTELAGEPVQHLAAARWHCATLMTFWEDELGTNDLPEWD
jgi:hypothetical protein